MKFVKKNKFTVLAVALFVILAFGAYKVKEIFFPNSRTAIYGDRLDGKIAVESSVYDSVKTKVSENSIVKSVETRESGKLINIQITVNDDVSINDAKKITDNLLEPFTESQIGYYDFQIFISKEDKSNENFPIIGYKHHNSSGFAWNKDR